MSSDLSLEDREVIAKLAEDCGQPLLVTADGQAAELPAAIRQLLVFAGNAMSKKKAIYVVQEDRAMTTQEAADFLGVSRQFLVGLLEGGKMPFHTVGSHLRVQLKDLAHYRLERDRKRSEVLNKSTEELVKAGVYYRFLPLEREQG